LPDRTAVFACEPQPIIIEALERILSESPCFEFAGACAVLAAALEQIQAVRPRVVLIDQSYGLKAAGQFVAAIGAVAPGSHAVLWVASCDGDDWVRAFQLGMRAVLRKTLPVSSLLQCLEVVAAGQLWMEDSLLELGSGGVSHSAAARLTAREREVVRCVCRGLRNREIASELGITPGTVKVHLMHVFEKTGVKDRFELAAYGHRLLAPLAGKG
jgi:two-component system, NarL family, nitrate/nitrite response regulator NarL